MASDRRTLRAGVPGSALRLAGGVRAERARGRAQVVATQALLPLVGGGLAHGDAGGLPRGLLTDRKGPRARAAVSLKHHALVRLIEQLELQFPEGSPAVYVHEGARQALERRLAIVGKAPVSVAIHDNRHSMIHAVRRDGILRARLHHMFLDAPIDVVEALGRFLFFRDREASHVVGRYIDQNMGRIRSLEPHRRSTKPNQGAVHDLDALFAEVNRKYFDGLVDASICWAADGRPGPRATLKLGSYSAQERLIRIHPRLDRPWVPRYFVAFVVFHEMLHHVIPAVRVAGRRVLHPPHFRARERDYRHYDRAQAWEHAHIDRLLRG
jgi:hypothetical protein